MIVTISYKLCPNNIPHDGLKIYFNNPFTFDARNGITYYMFNNSKDGFMFLELE